MPSAHAEQWSFRHADGTVNIFARFVMRPGFRMRSPSPGPPSVVGALWEGPYNRGHGPTLVEKWARPITILQKPADATFLVVSSTCLDVLFVASYRPSLLVSVILPTIESITVILFPLSDARGHCADISVDENGCTQPALSPTHGKRCNAFALWGRDGAGAGIRTKGMRRGSASPIACGQSSLSPEPPAPAILKRKDHRPECRVDGNDWKLRYANRVVHSIHRCPTNAAVGGDPLKKIVSQTAPVIADGADNQDLAKEKI